MHLLTDVAIVDVTHDCHLFGGKRRQLCGIGIVDNLLWRACAGDDGAHFGVHENVAQCSFGQIIGAEGFFKFLGRFYAGHIVDSRESFAFVKEFSVAIVVAVIVFAEYGVLVKFARKQTASQWNADNEAAACQGFPRRDS